MPTRAIYTGDNLPILRYMDSETVDLIYLDPPFNSGKQWANPVQASGRRAMAEFKDTWDLNDIHADHEFALGRQFPAAVDVINAMSAVNGESWKAYLIYMGVRLMEMRRILKPTGSIYYHCDPVMSHGVKILLDTVFGAANFRNEIIWHYRRMPAKQNQFQKMHDVILFFSAKKNNNTFNAPHGDMTPASRATIERARQKGYNVNLKKKMATIFDWDKYNAAVKSGALPPDLSAKASSGNGPYLNACWTDIPILAPTAKERTGYPTQKPLALLERIIKASSNIGDVVLDPFCGCATTCLAAERLGRNWIGIDLSEATANLVVTRLRKESDRTLVSASDDIQHLRRPPRRTDLRGLRTNDRILRPRLHKQQGGDCPGCERKVDLLDMELDHIIATSRGGQNIDENLQLLCGRCNSRKGDRGMDYLRQKILRQRAAEEMQLWRRLRNEELTRRGF